MVSVSSFWKRVYDYPIVSFAIFWFRKNKEFISILGSLPITRDGYEPRIWFWHFGILAICKWRYWNGIAKLSFFHLVNFGRFDLK